MTGRGTHADALVSVERWAKSWFLGPSGEDLLSLDGLPSGWAIHIEVADAVLAAVLPLIGQPARVIGRPIYRGLKTARAGSCDPSVGTASRRAHVVHYRSRSLQRGNYL